MTLGFVAGTAYGDGDAHVVQKFDGTDSNTSTATFTVKASACQRGESNPRPRAYESPALPLSYPGYYADNTQLIFDTLREIE